MKNLVEKLLTKNMKIKELVQKLNEFDQNNKISIDGKKLIIYDEENWFAYICLETDDPENTELTHEEKIKYLQMAWTIVSRMQIDLKSIDMIVSLSDLIDIKKGETDLKSICEVKKIVDKRFAA
jgi:CRISPR/Cas system CMR-associated protein Cmr3 (group 5 of RAMP superfamily)